VLGLREAIWDRFNASQGAGTVYAAVSGRMRYGRVRNTDDMPYIIYTFVSDTPFRAFGIETFNKIRVSFTCWDERDQANIEDVASKLRARFDDCTLTYAGAELSHIDVTRQAHFGPDWLANEAGGGAWRDVTDYMVTVQE